MSYPIIGYERKARCVNGWGDLTADAWGVQKVSLPVSLFHGLFTYDIPPRQWLTYNNGIEVSNGTGGTVVSEGGALKIVATAAVYEVIAGSKRHPRYQPNRGHLYSASMIFTQPTASGVRDFGLFTEENGVFFRLKSDGQLYAVLLSNHIETREERIDTSVFGGFDVSKGNIYDIQFQWRGVGNYNFYIGDPSIGTSKLVHQFTILGTLDSLSINNPALPCRFRSTSLAPMYCGCVDVTSENGLPSEKSFYTSTISDTKTVTSDTPIIAIRQPVTILGKHNTRDARLLRLSVTSDKKAVMNFYMTRDPAAVIGGSWVTINGGIGSYVEENRTATSVDITKMHRVTSILCEANTAREVTNPDPQIVDFILVHGDYIVLTGTGPTAGMQAVIEWGEEV